MNDREIERKVAVLRAGEEEFGIEISRVVEIVNAQRVYLLPQLPSFLSGMVNIRGEVIPLLDLRKRFGITSTAEKERIVVVLSGREKIGLLVDDVKEIIDLDRDEIIQPPTLFKGLKTAYLTGIGKRGDSIIILINLDSLLTSEEKIQLEEMAKSIEVEHGGNE